ncbi:transcriptional repressor [Boudabousia tangfeifanii]|uniref:Transcriptional repressor n=1 Tax=Boudabousia tangfeifanii TaxID=1912795 RepID=A0A1D9MKR6_9ACTO|nr:transcriptional repressor [Boudabousia tangfeifanii]AOZ72907.1 transcriptional repressor [Boudabousia tangfeifanii]
MQRMTRQRAAIEKAIAETDQFRSAQQLHDDLKEAGENIGLATVYRTLQAMAADDEIDMVRSEDGETRYRRCLAFVHHHHLICRNCDRTIEVEAGPVEAWIKEVAEEHGFSDLTHLADITGICEDCKNAKEN